ncbi:MAG: TPM domain-containing protein [Thermoplasmata archaeon]|nr:MAG: TPM domain-containing protein [Thermoplasmata archaeon]
MSSRRLPRGPVAVVLASILFAAAASLALAADDDYPTLKYWVTDDANVLLYQEELDIEALCVEAFEAKGVEIAVLTVNTTAPDDISMYAVRTFEKNELGQEGKDDGVLVMVATDDRTWRIEVGYGLEGVLPDILVADIANTYLVPDLERGDYYSGLLYTVAFLGREILDNYEEGEPAEDDGDPYPISWLPLTWGQLILVVVIFLVIALFTGGRGLWLGSIFYGSGGRRWGGGRSGGGGARGKW